MAIVLPDSHLFTGTVLENIRYDRLSATDDGSNLSQGQRQLLTIARATVAEASILILDEATSSIDTRKVDRTGYRHPERGKTAFVIAHRLSTIRNADEIVVLEHGRVIERGNQQVLMAKKGNISNYIPGSLLKYNPCFPLNYISRI